MRCQALSSNSRDKLTSKSRDGSAKKYMNKIVWDDLN